MPCIAHRLSAGRRWTSDALLGRKPHARDAGVRHHGDGRPGVHDEHLLPGDVHHGGAGRDQSAARRATCEPLDADTAVVLTVLGSLDGEGVTVYLGDGRGRRAAQRRRRAGRADRRGRRGRRGRRARQTVLIKAEKKVRLARPVPHRHGRRGVEGVKLHVAVMEKDGRVMIIRFYCPICGKRLEGRRRLRRPDVGVPALLATITSPVPAADRGRRRGADGEHSPNTPAPPASQHAMLLVKPRAAASRRPDRHDGDGRHRLLPVDLLHGDVDAGRWKRSSACRRRKPRRARATSVAGFRQRPELCHRDHRRRRHGVGRRRGGLRRPGPAHAAARRDEEGRRCSPACWSSARPMPATARS